ncbi:MAG: ROK family protein [Quadrisphaera sp.]
MAALGVELGADHLVACVRDLTGAVRARASVPEIDRTGSPDLVLRASADLAADVLGQAAHEGLDVVGAAWAVPGLVDAVAGRLRLAPNLGWRDVPVLDLLREHPALAGLPLAVDNEAALAAVAELWNPGARDDAGARPAPRSFLLVTGEVGIGGGVALDGRVLRGQRGWSGELGHVTVDPDGPRCGCGARGCLEAYAGQEALLARAGLPVRPRTSRGAVGGTPALLRAAAEVGHPGVLEALRDAGRALGVGPVRGGQPARRRRGGARRLLRAAGALARGAPDRRAGGAGAAGPAAAGGGARLGHRRRRVRHGGRGAGPAGRARRTGCPADGVIAGVPHNAGGRTNGAPGVGRAGPPWWDGRRTRNGSRRSGD